MSRVETGGGRSHARGGMSGQAQHAAKARVGRAPRSMNCSRQAAMAGAIAPCLEAASRHCG